MAAVPPADADSQMLSSPSDSDVDNTAQTPAAHQSSSTLSPPDSQHRNTRAGNMPVTSAGANANGKRPLNTISNGDLEDGTRSIDQPRREFPTKTHAASGYKWDRAEDEPGYSWLNKKAKDEYNRAYDAMCHKDHMVLGRYGDPFEMADHEKAVKESLQKS